MKIDGEHLQSIWYAKESDTVKIIDQTLLPHKFKVVDLKNLSDACNAINSMKVRGAPLIGVTAAYGVYLELKENPKQLESAMHELLNTRPTAINLRWALGRMHESLRGIDEEVLIQKALETALLIEKEDAAICEAIGNHGLPLLQALWNKKKDHQECLNILTHCNAGALAAVDWGTALSVIYKTAEAGVPIHVWVDETRPRNQGASLTCWELSKMGVSNTLIVDNAGGHLMQIGQVDVCVVGSDRTTRCGDVCNKIGTYLKALAARASNIPFYAALPVSTIDFSIRTGVGNIPIEERPADEISYVCGIDETGERSKLRIVEEGTRIKNYGFDVTPAEFISGIITEKGVFQANEMSLREALD